MPSAPRLLRRSFLQRAGSIFTNGSQKNIRVNPRTINRRMSVETFAYTRHRLEWDGRLAASMHKHRGDQFGKRLSWSVSIDDDGCEIDQYDDEQCLYVGVMKDRTHILSCRVRPFVTGSMLSDHFGDLFTEDARSLVDLERDFEITRLCRAPLIGAQVASEAMFQLFEKLHFMQKAGLFRSLIGVVYPPTKKVLQRVGLRPRTLAAVSRHKRCLQLIQIVDRAELRRPRNVASKIEYIQTRAGFHRPTDSPSSIIQSSSRDLGQSVA